jgi:hypothetical protein
MLREGTQEGIGESIREGNDIRLGEIGVDNKN